MGKPKKTTPKRAPKDLTVKDGKTVKGGLSLTERKAGKNQPDY